jgi:CDP-paratose 2-epimerase
VKILITGICGFAGSAIAKAWREAGSQHEIIGVDSLVRAGSETNRVALRRLGVEVIHADVRMASDFEGLPRVDAVIDAAALPSILAGIDGRTSSRQIVEHNLLGTLNILEYCRRTSAAFVMLSTSRVYSIPPLAALPVRIAGDAFEPDQGAPLPPGLSSDGISETFSTSAPVSLYGATKLASEALALEYGSAFDFPVWINRCGVMAGAGQFGRADQGIFSYWIHSWLRGRPLRYIGFDGQGHQVRDCLHPADLVLLLDRQLSEAGVRAPRIINISGGKSSAISLRQLSAWCEARMGPRNVGSDPRPRAFDLPWVVLDAGEAKAHWNWTPQRTASDILEEILVHAQSHPDWLELSAGG